MYVYLRMSVFLQTQIQGGIQVGLTKQFQNPNQSNSWNLNEYLNSLEMRSDRPHKISGFWCLVPSHRQHGPTCTE